MKMHERKTACFIRHGFFPKDVRVLRQAKTLGEEGFSVDIICLREEGQTPEEWIDGVHIHRVMATHKRGSTLRYLFQYALSFVMMGLMVTKRHLFRRYSVIQVVTMPDFLVFVTLIPKLMGAKVLLDMQEPIPELWMTKFGTARTFPLKLLFIMERWSIRYADRVVTVNATIRERFIRRGAPRWKIGLSRNVTDETVIRPAVRSTEKRHFTIMTHGTIEEHYGHETIIHALEILKDKVSDIHLVIIGDGKHKQRLIEMVEERKLSPYVTFENWLPYHQLPDHIARADIGIIPRYASPFAELCQPLKLFDYVALKTPVIITRFAAIEESFDSRSLYYIEPGNPEALASAVINLHDHPEKGRKYARNAYDTYKTSLRWHIAKNDYLETVHAMIDSPSNRFDRAGRSFRKSGTDGAMLEIGPAIQREGQAN